MNKHLAYVLAVSLVTLPVVAGSAYTVAAAETATCEPTVTTKDVKETSVKLKISCADFTKTKVTMKVLITNKETDKDSTKTVKATLGKTGSVTIKMSGLDSTTDYSFKVKVKKSSASKYSAYSTSVEATTKGADYDIAIDKINGITEDSVKLHIQSDDLESEKVNVIAAYKKKNDWSTKSFTLTLDGDGEGSFTLDGLKSGTEYSFKVKIREDGESSYSKYSEIKKETTDED